MRKWIKAIPPKMLHDKLGIYNGIWMPQMDRCWRSDDGYSVMSRLINTKWGKVEHVTIQKVVTDLGELSGDGSKDIPWKIKQEIKNELFGENKTAIEIFPDERELVDVCDVYHLWIFEKGFKIPFGIHPDQAKLSSYINRGYNFTEQDSIEYEEFSNKMKTDQTKDTQSIIN